MAIILLLITSVTGYGQSQVIAVAFQGNEKTKTAFLNKIVRLRPGLPFDSTLIKKDMDRLKLLPAVAHAYFQLVQEEEPGAYKEIYGIDQNFTIIPFANVYTSVNDEFAFRVGLQEFNFLGQGMTLGAFYQDDIFSSFELNFRVRNLYFLPTVPRNIGTIMNLLSYWDFMSSINNIVSNLGLIFFTEDYQYMSGATDPNVPQRLNLDKYLYKIIYDFNDIEYYNYFLSGFRSLLNLQLVRSQNQVLPDFNIGCHDFFYLKRLGSRGNWANRLHFGFQAISIRVFPLSQLITILIFAGWVI